MCEHYSRIAAGGGRAACEGAGHGEGYPLRWDGCTQAFDRVGNARSVGGSLGVVADTSTPVPGATGNFETFGEPSLSGADVAFRAVQITGLTSGIYTNIAGSLNVVADTSTLAPGGTGSFESFGDPSLSGGNVAFRGVGPGGSDTGIFVAFDGLLQKVLGVSDVLDGRAITDLTIGRPALSGNQLAFRATFADFSQGIYVATIIPEPSTAVLIGCGLIALAGSRRNRRRDAD